VCVCVYVCVRAPLLYENAITFPLYALFVASAQSPDLSPLYSPRHSSRGLSSNANRTWRSDKAMRWSQATVSRTLS
jgi:hypothetical protein